jgi:hypothetical protein
MWLSTTLFVAYDYDLFEQEEWKRGRSETLGYEIISRE